jgi:hypothetical protein
VCPTSDDWTEEEIRDLLEALMFVGEEWDVVAQTVKTKTMEQCVLQFARLPIADRYLQDFNPWYHYPCYIHTHTHTHTHMCVCVCVCVCT